MVFRRVSGAVWTRTEGMPSARIAYGVVSSAGIAALAYVWWPNGNYRPILPGERGTVAGAVHQWAQVPSGGPSLGRQRRGTPQQKTQPRTRTTTPQRTTRSRTTPTYSAPGATSPTVNPTTTDTTSATTATTTTYTANP